MARKWRVRYAGARYHVTQRGNGRGVIFHGEADYERFLQQLDSALEADDVKLLAYVLMPNHYHLFIETPRGNISRFMLRLNTAYGMYYRHRKQRPGHCFQGRYGATLVGGEGYPLRLTRYIHLNPVWTQAEQKKPVAGRVKTLTEFEWSSYRGYAGLAKAEERIDYQLLGEMDRLTDKGRRLAYRAYAESMVGGEDEVLKVAKERGRYALGDERFVEEAEEELNEAKLRRVIKGAVDWPVKKCPGLDETIRKVCRTLDLDEKALRVDGRTLGEKKGLALEAICRISGASQRDVATALKLPSEVTVGYQRRRLAGQLATNNALAKQLDQLLDDHD